MSLVRIPNDMNAILGAVIDPTVKYFTIDREKYLFETELVDVNEVVQIEKRLDQVVQQFNTLINDNRLAHWESINSEFPLSVKRFLFHNQTAKDYKIMFIGFANHYIDNSNSPINGRVYSPIALTTFADILFHLKSDKSNVIAIRALWETLYQRLDELQNSLNHSVDRGMNGPILHYQYENSTSHKFLDRTITVLDVLKARKMNTCLGIAYLTNNTKVVEKLIRDYPKLLDAEEGSTPNLALLHNFVHPKTYHLAYLSDDPKSVDLAKQEMGILGQIGFSIYYYVGEKFFLLPLKILAMGIWFRH